MCRDLIKTAIQAAENSLADAVSRNILSVTGMPYYPEVITIPEPMARPAPVRVMFGVERTGVPLDPQHECSARVRVEGKPQGVRIGENVSNAPYASKAVPLRRQRVVGDKPGGGIGDLVTLAAAAIRGTQSFTVVLDEPKNLPYLPREDWMAARRAKGEFEPSGYSHILIGGNKLWASVESDCLPTSAVVPGLVRYAKHVPNRKYLRSQGRGPEWLPGFYDRHCGIKTERLVIPFLDIDLGIDVPRDPATFCTFWSNYLAGGV